MAQVFVSGTWREAKAEPFKDQAIAVGRGLATRGFDLACGPGTGIARHVIDGYTDVLQRGAVRYYLPRQDLMEAVGEAVEAGADYTEVTPFDYPMRNVYQVSFSDGVFILTGGDGALEEALPALIDYGLPVGVVTDSGPAAKALRMLTEVFPEWNDSLLFGEQAEDILDEFMNRVEVAAETHQRLTRPAAYLLDSHNIKQ